MSFLDYLNSGVNESVSKLNWLSKREAVVSIKGKEVGRIYMSKDDDRWEYEFVGKDGYEDFTMDLSKLLDKIEKHYK